MTTETQVRPEEPAVGTAGLWRVAVLAAGVFAVGTGEFVLAGMLPMLVTAFDISTAQAGQVVTVFAATCALSAPVLTTITAAWQRHTVLATATVIYLLGATGTALAATYPQILLAQVLAAAGVGLFVPNASVTAATLVPAHLRGRAIAIVVTGLTAAVAFGAPIGTALGGVWGWRATMWFAAGLAAVGLASVLAFVPRGLDTGSPDGGLRERLQPLRDPRVLALLATTLVGFTAVFVPYTYIGVIFEPATGGSGIALAALMFAGGVAGAVGNLASGFLTDRFGGARVVAVALVWLAVGLVLVPLAVHHLPAAFVLVAFYALASFAITTPQQHRLMTLRPDATSVVISLNQSVLYLAIALSGVVGATGIELAGAQHVSYLAAALALVALGLSEVARRFARRGTVRRQESGSTSGPSTPQGSSSPGGDGDRTGTVGRTPSEV